MKRQIAYEKTFEATLIRTKHKVSFKVGMTKFSLMEMLKHVPDNATIDEILDDENAEGIASIEFHEERIEK